MIKVAKFGGTSLADLEAMHFCCSIIRSDPDKRLIVLSATAGTTNLLTSIAEAGEKSVRLRLYEEIKERHLEILSGLRNPSAVEERLKNLLKELKSTIESLEQYDLRSRDELLSFGERLSSTLFYGLLLEEGLNVELLDSRRFIKTDSTYGDAEPLIDQIRQRAGEGLLPELKRKIFVAQGFIGSDADGMTTTLGRGGSDFSAALYAEAVDADVLEIWTDVDAVYTADPRVVPVAEPITEISFSEAAELSVFGAKVLHPATLKPAIRKNIRVYVGSSREPGRPGTWIVKNPSERPVIRAVSLRRGQTLLNVHSLDMLHRHGFLSRLFQILANHKISVDLVTTSEVNVSLTLDTDHQGIRQRLSPTILKELESIAEVEVERNLALIALVGNRLEETPGVSGPLFKLLDQTNVRLVCHGASSHNLCFLVEDDQATEVVNKLHEYFIHHKDRALS